MLAEIRSDCRSHPHRNGHNDFLGEPSATITTRFRRTWLERLPPWVKRIATIGVASDDSEEERLRKASLVLTATIVTVLAVVWVATYAMLGLYVSAAIPFGYQVISVASVVLLARTGRFGLFRTSQLTLMLVLPVLLQWSLGGFLASSGVMLWALVSPLGALIWSDRPLPCFSGYLALTVISGVIEPLLTPAPDTRMVEHRLLCVECGGVSTVVYFLLRYFMRGLAAERHKSETLLLNVLPSSIASRLKAGERPLADRFEEVAVLFADMVGFTPHVRASHRPRRSWSCSTGSSQSSMRWPKGGTWKR